jgi:uncharacterized membrane protein
MIKPENLQQASSIEKYRAQYQQIRNDPRVKQQIVMYYNKAQKLLPGGVKPEYAAGAAVTALLLLIFMIGFTKMMMVISLIMLLGVIVGPDVMTTSRSTVNWRVVALNFPRRCRETIEQTVPIVRGKLTDKMAAGFVLFMILMVGKTLFTSPPSSVPPRAPPAQTIDNVPSSTSLEEAYKLGFDDASSNKPFGMSSLESLKPSPTVNNEIPYDYIPSSPPASKGGFGFGTAMSMVIIGRSVMQLGMIPGQGFDVSVAMANLQTLPVYQQGLLGFSVYNVLRAFF